MPNLELILIKDWMGVRLLTGRMRRTQHQLMILVLALALALVGGSRSMALAHGSSGQALVICSDGAEATVYIDASGNLVDPPMDCSKCPECMDNPVSVLATSGSAEELYLTQSSRYVRPDPDSYRPSRNLRPQSRGPPVWTLDRSSLPLEAIWMPCAPSLHLGSCVLRVRVSQSICS
jgi:hypothetical protein